MPLKPKAARSRINDGHWAINKTSEYRVEDGVIGKLELILGLRFQCRYEALLPHISAVKKTRINERVNAEFARGVPEGLHQTSNSVSAARTTIPTASPISNNQAFGQVTDGIATPRRRMIRAGGWRKLVLRINFWFSTGPTGHDPSGDGSDETRVSARDR